MKPLCHSLSFVLCLLAACTAVNEKKAVTEDKTHYNNLILTTAINILANKPKLDPAFTSIYNFREDTFGLLKIQKEVYESSLGIKMRIHKWIYDCSPCNHITLIYVANNDGFEFVFPFNFDKSLTPTLYAKENMWKDESRKQFNDFLIYVSYRIKLKDKNEMENILRLFADSLLELKKLTLKDTSLFKQVYIKQLRSDSLNPSIQYENTETLKTRIDKIIVDITNKTSGVYWYMSTLPNKVFWKFTIKQGDYFYSQKKEYPPIFYLTIEFTDTEYYQAVRF